MAFDRVGYGQVEPNQLSAQKTGQIYASLPLDSTVKVLQNGEFMIYSYADNKVTADPTVAGQEPMLVFNEIKLYEPFWRTSYKDFAMIRVGDNYVTSKLATAEYGDGALTVGVVPSTTNPPSAINSTGHVEDPYRMDGIAPRLFKTNVGDIMTTNMVDENGTYAEKDLLGLKTVTIGTAPNDYKVLRLCPAADADAGITMRWVVAKDYTMPDGQRGLKLQRII